MSDNTADHKSSDPDVPPEDVEDTVVKTDPEVDEEVQDLKAQDRSDVLPQDIQIRNLDSDDTTTLKLLRQGVRLKRGLITPRVFYPAIIVLALTATISIVFPDASGRALLG